MKFADKVRDEAAIVSNNIAKWKRCEGGGGGGGCGRYRGHARRGGRGRGRGGGGGGGGGGRGVVVVAPPADLAVLPLLVISVVIVMS